VVDVIEAEHAAFWMKDEAAFLRCYRRSPDLLRWGYWQGGGMFRRSGWDEVVAASVAHMRALPRPIPEFAFAGIANLTLRVAGDVAWASYDRHHPHVDGMLGHGPNGTIHLIRVLERHQGSWFIAATVLLDAHLGDEVAVRVTADRDVVWTSGPAAARLADDPDFVVRAGRLRLRQRRLDARLAAAIGWAAGLGGPLMPRRGAVPLVVENIPGLTRVAWVLAEDQKHALVLLDDLRPLASRIGQAARIYELSPAQSRLALAVAEGRSLPEFAAEAGVSLNTARTHLRRVFAKAGASSQAELVARLLSLTPPR
jgi:DNA-binding CsgD family transcriptional regulator